MRKLICFLVPLIILSCASLDKYKPLSDIPEVEVTVTYSDESLLLSEREPIHFYQNENIGSNTIIVDKNKEFQVFEGFGGGLTQSSAYLIYNHPDKEIILNELFSKDGLGLNFIRLPLGASDFSLDWYSYADEPGDVDLNSFSIAQDEKYTIPVLKEILEINPNIKIIGSPWSAPGWMKSGNVRGEMDLAGGFLAPEYYELYADYLVKAIEAYKDHGITLNLITLQNEPLHYSASYPCMYMSSDHQREFIKILGPKLDNADFETKILLYDHNWDNPGYPRDTLDFLENEYFKYIEGAAFHGYAGSPDGQTTFKLDYPEMKIYFTEITGGGWAEAFAMNLRWIYQNVLIGSIRNWSSSTIFWNLVLDEIGGPNIRIKTDKREGMMRGVLTADSESGDIIREVEYYALAQMSKFVKPGAVRIHTTDGPGEVTSVAFKNPDGEIVLVVLNGSWVSDASFKVVTAGKSFKYSLPVESVATFVWR